MDCNAESWARRDRTASSAAKLLAVSQITQTTEISNQGIDVRLPFGDGPGLRLKIRHSVARPVLVLRFCIRDRSVTERDDAFVEELG
jgi:hypothetical protein